MKPSTQRELIRRFLWRWSGIICWFIIVYTMLTNRSFLSGLALGFAAFYAYTRIISWLFEVRVEVDNGER